MTDTAGMLIGIVTIDDVLDVAEATATSEIQRIGGSEALDEPYISIAFGRMIQKRAGWLTALFLGEMLTATAMGAFEEEIAKAVVLALFVPLIISSGGNSGSQAATLVIRALALGEVGAPRLVARDAPRDPRRARRSAPFSAASDSCASPSGRRSPISTARIGCWSRSRWRSSLVGVVLWGTLSGSLLPFLLEAAGVRPGRVLGAIRGHARRRDRPGDLLLGRPRRSARNAAVTSCGGACRRIAETGCRRVAPGLQGDSSPRVTGP